MKDVRQGKVFVYTRVLPFQTGSGAQVRVYTNIRAYCDLNYDVEVIKFNDPEEPDLKEIAGLKVKIRSVSIQPHQPSIWTRLGYFLGFPTAAVLDYLYPIRKQVQKELIKNQKRNPDAIHHFEYLDLACAVVGIDKFGSVWSNHDLDSQRFNHMHSMRKAKVGGKSEWRKAIQLNRIKLAERVTSEKSKLVLTIAEHETAAFKQAYGEDKFHLLPMSCPDENLVSRKRPWVDDGVLRFLHLGSVDGFIGYDSIKFILNEVFPLLPPDVIDSLEMWVVGRVGESPYSHEIIELSTKYPFVKFTGFVDDLKSIYSQVDLQLVGGTRASGLRTRIVESMVFGVPVLSTVEMAKGLYQLRDKGNIFLAADAREFANEIIAILNNPDWLPKVATAARETYEEFYSRKVEAETLAYHLKQYL